MLQEAAEKKQEVTNFHHDINFIVFAAQKLQQKIDAEREKKEKIEQETEVWKDHAIQVKINYLFLTLLA